MVSNQTKTWTPLPGYSKCLLPRQSNHTNNPYGQWIQNTTQNTGFNDSATYNCLVRTDENPYATTNSKKKWNGNEKCEEKDTADTKFRRCLGQQSNKCIDGYCKFFSKLT